MATGGAGEEAGSGHRRPVSKDSLLELKGTLPTSQEGNDCAEGPVKRHLDVDPWDLVVEQTAVSWM